MKNILIIIICLIPVLNFGQINIKNSVIDSGGESSTQGTTMIVASVGEFAVQENTQGSFHLSEGFVDHSVYTLGIETYTKLKGVRIFPNPVINHLNFNFEKEGNYQIMIYDINGKLTGNYETRKKIYQIPVKHLNTNTFLVIVKENETKKYVTFKMIRAK